MRGTKGKNFYQKDRFNRIIGSYENGIFDVPPKNSNNLTLTIDLDIQEYGEKLMKNKTNKIINIQADSVDLRSRPSTLARNTDLSTKISINSTAAVMIDPFTMPI